MCTVILSELVFETVIYVDVVVTSCPLLEDCVIGCQFGFISDENGCRTCQCHESCKVCRSLTWTFYGVHNVLILFNGADTG